MLKNKITKIIGLAVIAVLIAPAALTFAQSSATPTLYQVQQREREVVQQKLKQASSTANALQNREANIERVQNRIASTTASTTQKRVDQLQAMLAKQKQQMEALKIRVANMEMRAITVVENIAKRLGERMTILKDKGLVMTQADALYSEALAKIADAKVQADKIKNILATSTASSTDSVFVQVKDLQAIIKVDLKNAQTKLVATIKAINSVRPKFEKPAATSTPATSTATTSNQ